MVVVTLSQRAWNQSVFLSGRFYYPSIFLTQFSFSGWPRRHHIFCSQLWRWGKRPQLPPWQFLSCIAVKDLVVTVNSPVCLTPVAGNCEQSAAAEAVGLEASSVHAHLEGHSHCARGQYDLWLHLHPPGHRSAASGFVVSVGSQVSAWSVAFTSDFYVCLLNCRWLWWNHKDLGCGETVLHSQPQRVLGCSTVSNILFVFENIVALDVIHMHYMLECHILEFYSILI